METNSAAWTGRAEEKSWPSLTELIDKYVPLRTRGQVWSMAAVYEERITDLLRTIHEYHDRCERMATQMDGMEREYYEKCAIPVSMGRLETCVDLDMQSFTRVYQIEWRPDPFKAVVRLREEALRREEHPHLVEGIVKQFERYLKEHLAKELTRQYAALYEGSR